MSTKQQLQASLKKITGEEVSIELTSDLSHGDYTTNIAMAIASKEKSNPHTVAKDILQKLSKDNEISQLVDKIEVAGPGFINFYINQNELKKSLVTSKNNKKKIKLSLEYGQPNTHKLPHIGHLFSYVYGESLARILSESNYEVRRVNYQGDVGLHVAKCLWSLQKEKPTDPDILEDKVKLLQEHYQKGSKAYEEDESAKVEIQQINKNIYAKDSSIMELWKKTRRWSLDYYKLFEARLGISYNRSYFESEVYDKGLEIVESNLGKVFVESEGAIIFPGSQYGLHDRVFITRFKTPTYEAKDLALAKLKYEEQAYDKLIITTAHEQNAYFDVIFKALEMVSPELSGKLNHLGFGMVNLKTGKMSSRTGQIVSGIDLVDITVSEIKKIVVDREDLSDKEKQEISETVGIGAVKFSLLKSNPFQDVKFDLEESISKEGYSGPYVQYTYARAKSVLSKAKNNVKGLTIEGKLNPEEDTLLHILSRFQEIIDGAGKIYSPHIIAKYLFDLSQVFNSFYNKHKILEDDNETVRLSLTKLTADTVAKGLWLLGIDAPEKM